MKPLRFEINGVVGYFYPDTKWIRFGTMGFYYDDITPDSKVRKVIDRLTK